ncbi:MAG: hypothetical protein ACFE0Q_08215 [Anaerolineae bacterium]
MIQGVIQRLKIVYETDTRLVLRELPLLDWAAAFMLVLIGLGLSLFDFWVSAVLAAGLAFYFVLQGRVRLIEFDAPTARMIVQYRTPFSQSIASDIDLYTVHRAYLFKGDDGGTQVILVRADGEELGISVYSSDPSPWKEAVVIAINALLHEVHKDDDETDLESFSDFD